MHGEASQEQDVAYINACFARLVALAQDDYAACFRMGPRGNEDVLVSIAIHDIPRCEEG